MCSSVILQGVRLCLFLNSPYTLKSCGQVLVVDIKNISLLAFYWMSVNVSPYSHIEVWLWHFRITGITGEVP